MKITARVLLVLVMVISVVGMSIIGCAKEQAPTAPTSPAAPATTSPAKTTPATTAPSTPTTTKPAPAPSAQTFKWKFTTTEPKGTQRWHVYEVLASNLEKESQGRLSLTLYPTGQLVAGPDMLDALAADVVQFCNTYGPYYQNFMPEAAIESGFPMVWKTVGEIDHTYFELGLLDIVREAYAERGVYYLTEAAGGGAFLWATKPVSALADFKGLKVRATGLRSELLATLGAACTYLPHEESFTALQLGTVQAYETAVATYVAFKHYEVCKYVHTPGLLDPGAVGFCVSVKARNALPEDLKLLLEAEGRNISWMFNYLDREAQDLILTNLSNYGAQTVQFSPETVQRMTEIGTQLMETFAKKSARCQKMVDIIKGYMKVKGYIK